MESLSVAPRRAAPTRSTSAPGCSARAELYRPYLGGGSAAIVTNEVVAPLYLPQSQERP